ncbi:MAG: hypothetical protein SOH81_08050 [Acetobacter sp.]|jgi:hypothetical protein
MTNTVQEYAVYRTVATDKEAIGYVYNRIIWDGGDGWAPDSGSAAVADQENLYPIGSVYSVSAS